MRRSQTFLLRRLTSRLWVNKVAVGVVLRLLRHPLSMSATCLGCRSAILSAGLHLIRVGRLGLLGQERTALRLTLGAMWRIWPRRGQAQMLRLMRAARCRVSRPLPTRSPMQSRELSRALVTLVWRMVRRLLQLVTQT